MLLGATALTIRIHAPEANFSLGINKHLVSWLLQYGRVSYSQRYKHWPLPPPPARQTKDRLRMGQAPTKSSNRSTYTPYPNPLIRKNTPVTQTSTLVQASSSEPAANRASPRASAVLPSPYFWFRGTLLSPFWSKLIAFIFQPDVAVTIPGVSGEF